MQLWIRTLLIQNCQLLVVEAFEMWFNPKKIIKQTVHFEIVQPNIQSLGEIDKGVHLLDYPTLVNLLRSQFKRIKKDKRVIQTKSLRTG